jgi:flagellin
LIIRHNITALNNQRKLTEANRNSAKSMEKLSSGLRISRAGDDAAGLAISEKMRGQIRGLGQAERNVQDGISLIQTAEGGLNEIHASLQRIRELSVQAANDSNTKSDRSEIQKEIKQLRDSIDNVANHTEFNTMKVLRPPVNTVHTTMYGKTDIVFIVDVSGSMGGTIDNVITNLDDFVGNLESNNLEYRLGLVSYSEINDGEPLTKWDFADDASSFKNNMIAMRSNMLGGGDTNESGLEAINDPVKGALTFPFHSDSSKQFILITDAPVHDKEGDGLSTYDIDATALDLASKEIKLNIVAPELGSVKEQLKKLTEPTGGASFNIHGNFSEELNSLAVNIVGDSSTTVESDEMPILELQIGSNAFQSFSIDLFDARTPKLGIENLSVESFTEANNSIELIDQAIPGLGHIKID